MDKSKLAVLKQLIDSMRSLEVGGWQKEFEDSSEGSDPTKMDGVTVIMVDGKTSADPSTEEGDKCPGCKDPNCPDCADDSEPQDDPTMSIADRLKARAKRVNFK